MRPPERPFKRNSELRFSGHKPSGVHGQGVTVIQPVESSNLVIMPVSAPAKNAYLLSYDRPVPTVIPILSFTPGKDFSSPDAAGSRRRYTSPEPWSTTIE